MLVKNDVTLFRICLLQIIIVFFCIIQKVIKYQKNNFLNQSYFILRAGFNPSTHLLTGKKDWPSIVKSNDVDLKLKEIV